MTEDIETTSETVRRLAALVVENGLAELIVEDDGLTVTIKVDMESAPSVHSLAIVAHPVPQPQTPQSAVTAPTPKPARSTTMIALESPMVGVFYRSPSPEDPAFVAVGDLIKVGQPIGLIEAMKVYSEVPAEAAGRVVEMPVESGKLVQQGQPLIYLEPQ